MVEGLDNSTSTENLNKLYMEFHIGPIMANYIKNQHGYSVRRIIKVDITYT